MVDIAMLLHTYLQKAGFAHVEVVTDPTKAMSISAKLDPDLIILDLWMPVLDGFEVLALLRETPDPPPVLVLTADCSRAARNKALAFGAKDFLSKPYDHEELVLRAKNLLETRALHRELRQMNSHLERAVSERTADLWQAVQEVEKSANALRHSQEQTVIRLALAAELRDDETKSHNKRVSGYCEILARAAGYDTGSAELLSLASVMHDVGKIGIPSKIVLARGKLRPEDRAIMQGHCEIGFRILDGSRTSLLDTAASIALTHHERYDGSGYPRGLKGEEIPLEGRIAAIADVFDALTTDRVYRRRYQLGPALQIMKGGRGTLFDPQLLDHFFDSLNEMLQIKEDNDDVADRSPA